MKKLEKKNPRVDPNTRLPKHIVEKVGESLGHASMCWDITPTGAFDSSRVNVIHHNLCHDIADYVNLRASGADKVRQTRQSSRFQRDIDTALSDLRELWTDVPTLVRLALGFMLLMLLSLGVFVACLIASHFGAVMLIKVIGAGVALILFIVSAGILTIFKSRW